MLRQLHAIVGLITTLLVIVISLSGAVLSLQPVLEYANTAQVKDQTVAELAQLVTDKYAGVESIQRSPSGTVTVYFTNDNGSGEAQINPQTGLSKENIETASFLVWVKDLHRSLLLGESGRMVVGGTAVVMIALAISGVGLLLVRFGSWRTLFISVRGSLAQKIHCAVGRFVVLALLLTALTGSYLSAVRFNILPEGEMGFADFPSQVDGGASLPIAQLSALKNVKVTDFEELIYPYMGDPNDFYSLSTDQGMGYIDQATGEMLAFQAHSIMYKFYKLVHSLHTGEGLWWLGLILGLASLNLPVICVSGVLIWWQRRSALPKLKGNYTAKRANTLILVGSEGNHTWGFAQALHNKLTAFGYQVCTSDMNHFAQAYPKVERVFILTSTYGAGIAPASATLFLKKLAQYTGTIKPDTVVLGFGDRQFSTYGKFAKDVTQSLKEKGFSLPLPLTLVDRESAQDFSRWGISIGQWLNKELNLSYTAKQPVTSKITLIERVDYGIEVQAPTSIFRFSLPPRARRGITNLFSTSNCMLFEPGDLIGILVSPSDAPRFYSIASGSKDNMLEICVRRQSEGLCSNYLHELTVGDSIEGFIKPNLGFKLPANKAPVILIGAGTGIGPLTGFIRQNNRQRKLYLYWGGRLPDSDYLYEKELDSWLSEGRLTELHSVFSRVPKGKYVQDELRIQGKQITALIQQGAQVMICGGRSMATEVEIVINELLKPLGRSVNDLKEQGYYREDVY